MSQLHVYIPVEGEEPLKAEWMTGESDLKPAPVGVIINSEKLTAHQRDAVRKWLSSCAAGNPPKVCGIAFEGGPALTQSDPLKMPLLVTP